MCGEKNSEKVLSSRVISGKKISCKLNWCKQNIFFFGGGMSGWAVNASHSRSGGPGFKSHPSGCFLTQGTLPPICLSSPKCINGYQQNTARGNPAMK